MPDLSRLPHGRAWHLAWPLMLSNLTTPMMGLADTAMLGHQDNSLFLAAAAIGANVLTFSLWIFGFLRMGTTSLTGRALGAGQVTEAKLLLYRSLILGAVLGLGLIVLQFFLLPQIVAFMTPDATVRQLATSYSGIRFAAAPAVLMTYAILGWFIGLQRSRIPLIITLAINLVNLLLDWLLIVVLGWGSDGAALASACAEYAGLALALLLASAELTKLRSQPIRAGDIWSHASWLALAHINSHLFIRTASLLGVFTFFTAQGAHLGADTVAANAILLQLLLLASHGLDGYAHAAETMVARTVGARDAAAFRSACLAAGVASLGLAALISLVFLVAESPLIWLLTDLENLREILHSYYGWLILLPLVSVWSYLFDGIFIGAGQTRSLRNWMLIAVLLIFLPAWWLTRPLENHGLWLAFTLFNLARGVTLAMVFGKSTRRWFGLV